MNHRSDEPIGRHRDLEDRLRAEAQVLRDEIARDLSDSSRLRPKSLRRAAESAENGAHRSGSGTAIVLALAASLLLAFGAWSLRPARGRTADAAPGPDIIVNLEPLAGRMRGVLASMDAPLRVELDGLRRDAQGLARALARRVPVMLRR